MNHDGHDSHRDSLRGMTEPHNTHRRPLHANTTRGGIQRPPTAKHDHPGTNAQRSRLLRRSRTRDCHSSSRVYCARRSLWNVHRRSDDNSVRRAMIPVRVCFANPNTSRIRFGLAVRSHRIAWRPSSGERAADIPNETMRLSR